VKMLDSLDSSTSWVRFVAAIFRIGAGRWLLLGPAFRLSNGALPDRRFRGHEAPRCAEQVSQRVLLDPGQSHQHGGIVRVVIGYVVHIRSTGKELRSLIEIDAHAQRPGLRGFVDRDTRQQLSANLERRRAVCRGLLHVRQLECDSSYRVEIDILPWH